MNRHQKGFTIIECLISIAVFSIAISGLSAMTVTAVKASSYSEVRTTATAMATDKMESLRNISYVDLVSGGPETLQTIYSRQWTVTNNSPVTNTKTIAVTVSCNWGGQTIAVTLSTIRTR